MSGMLFTWYIAAASLCSAAQARTRGPLLVNARLQFVISRGRLSQYEEVQLLSLSHPPPSPFPPAARPLPLPSFLFSESVLWAAAACRPHLRVLTARRAPSVSALPGGLAAGRQTRFYLHSALLLFHMKAVCLGTRLRRFSLAPRAERLVLCKGTPGGLVSAGGRGGGGQTRRPPWHVPSSREGRRWLRKEGASAYSLLIWGVSQLLLFDGWRRDLFKEHILH